MDKFDVAVCQLTPGSEKAENVETTVEYIDEAAARGCALVSLPEAFTCGGPRDAKVASAEPVPGPTTDRLAARAAEHGIYVHAGSLYTETPDPEKAQNTTVMIDDTGEIVATYDKIHLFDAAIDDQFSASESSRIVAGDSYVVAETNLGTLGFSICYDLRFPELYRRLSNQGATVLFVPAAFRLYTGKDHWEPLLRARAIENQAYVVAAGQIGEAPGSGSRYGKSMVVDPWGTVISQASDRPEMITATIDPDYLDSVRTNLPSLQHQRPDACDPGERN
jgi:predicted amidohydrolase